MISRRDLLKAGAVTGGSLLVLGRTRIPWASAAIPGGTLDTATIPKYVTKLLIPPVMPPAATIAGRSTDYYRIAMRRFRQQVLPPGFPTTTVWGYGAAPHGAFHSPAFTIEATADRPVRVQWINDLVDIPIAIQDRSFNADGSLFFPDSRRFFDGFGGPYIPDSDASPIYNNEFFGNAMMVNGHTWPSLQVEPRRYRFRFLNGCNSRFLILKIATSPTARRPARPALPFWQIGTEGGFLPAPIEIDFLLMGLAERADVVVDFTGLKPGTTLYLINEAPDEPYDGGRVGHDFEAADPATTGQVMRFEVVPLASRDTSVAPDRLTLPTFTPLGPSSMTRRVSLSEADSAVLPGVGPTAAFLGTLDAAGNPVPLRWMDPVTEHPALGATETWEISNFTADAHPIHIHEVMFQVVDREGNERGEPTGPEAWEAGFKDTVIAYPGQVTSVKARFDLPGRYV